MSTPKQRERAKALRDVAEDAREGEAFPKAPPLLRQKLAIHLDREADRIDP